MRRISDWREKTIWPNGWNTERDCILTGKDFLAKRVEHWRGLYIDGNRLSDQTGGTLTRIADWREKTIWLNGWNTDEDCILTGTGFLTKRVEHWRGLHIDGNRLSGQTGGTLTRIAYWREQAFCPNGWNTVEYCIFTGTGFLTTRVEHWRRLYLDGNRLSD
jgi:hypothetical protein